MNKQHGFTLIELLVVIAIIALLMSILMPALHKVRDQGRSTVCKANLRSWGMVWRMYADDHNGKFPDGNAGAGWERGSWIVSLRNYWERKDQILLCPNAKKHNVGVKWGSHIHAFEPGDDLAGQNELASYGLNLWCYSFSRTNIYNFQTRSIKSTLEFKKEGQLHVETHFQKYYAPDEIQKIALRCNLELCHVYYDYNKKDKSKKASLIIIIFKKIG